MRLILRQVHSQGVIRFARARVCGVILLVFVWLWLVLVACRVWLVALACCTFQQSTCLAALCSLLSAVCPHMYVC